MKPTILVVDDEPRLAEVLAVALGARGFRSEFVCSVAQAKDFLASHLVDLVIADLRMPERSGRDLLHDLRQERPDLPVVIATAYASMRDAVELVKEGAFDYLSKPFEIDDVVATIGRALQLKDTIDENRRLRDELERKYSFENLIGTSPAFQQVLRQITEVCGTRSTVLIQGESGTGKELVARAIHFNSPRRAKSFIALNCAAIPEALLESELFGHVKGAFTGAVGAREGRFAAANGGTLFLDEIGDMPIAVQAKVLRAIQEQVLEPVGSTQSIEVDVRIVAATHRDLRAMADVRTFREDLYYRLNVFPIMLPALRERRDDILLLASYFLRSFAEDMAKKVVGFTPATEAAMQGYSWPGNIRELQNCIERAVIVAKGNAIEIGDLPRYVFEDVGRGQESSLAGTVPHELDEALAKIERDFIVAAIEESGGVQAKAAVRLGISERSLWHRVKKLSIRIGKTAG